MGLPRTDNANHRGFSYSALNKRGRAGFVMADSASDARATQQELRRRIVEDRVVDATHSTE